MSEQSSPELELVTTEALVAELFRRFPVLVVGLTWQNPAGDWKSLQAWNGPELVVLGTLRKLEAAVQAADPILPEGLHLGPSLEGFGDAIT